MIFIASISLICIATAYITALICNQESSSSWQLIKYIGSSVEPKSIYICKKCNNQRDINYHYCDNCGAKMKNGVVRIYYTNGIKIYE